jgi:hypothetical protein
MSDTHFTSIHKILCETGSEHRFSDRRSMELEAGDIEFIISFKIRPVQQICL